MCEFKFGIVIFSMGICFQLAPISQLCLGSKVLCNQLEVFDFVSDLFFFADSLHSTGDACNCCIFELCRINSHSGECWSLIACTTEENKRYVNWQSFRWKEQLY